MCLYMFIRVVVTDTHTMAMHYVLDRIYLNSEVKFSLIDVGHVENCVHQIGHINLCMQILFY